MARGDNPARDREEDERLERIAWDAKHGVDAMARRKALMFRVPYGRALDAAHLAILVDSDTTENHGLTMRSRLVRWAAPQLTGQLVLTSRELDELKAHVEAFPTGFGHPASIPEWPASR